MMAEALGRTGTMVHENFTVYKYVKLLKLTSQDK